MQTKAVILGRSQARSLYGTKRFYTFLKLPRLWDTKILTFRTEGQDDFLPHGTKQADAILVEVDPDSLRRGVTGWVADIEVLDVWTEQEGEAGADGGEPEEAAE